MTRFDAVQYISHGIAKRPGMSENRSVRGTNDDLDTDEAGEKKGADALNSYCVNLNEKAKDGKIDPLIGREKEVSGQSKFCVADRKTTRYLWVIRALARPLLQKGLPERSSKVTCQKFFLMRRFFRSIWAHCSLVRDIAVTSKSGLKL